MKAELQGRAAAALKSISPSALLSWRCPGWCRTGFSLHFQVLVAKMRSEKVSGQFAVAQPGRGEVFSCAIEDESALPLKSRNQGWTGGDEPDLWSESFTGPEYMRKDQKILNFLFTYLQPTGIFPFAPGWILFVYHPSRELSQGIRIRMFQCSNNCQSKRAANKWCTRFFFKLK